MNIQSQVVQSKTVVFMAEFTVSVSTSSYRYQRMKIRARVLMIVSVRS
jgi:hypothetical protein